MAILGIKVPEDVAEELEEIAAPGEHVPPEEKHITLLYLGDNLPIETLGKIVMCCARVTECFKPFDVAVAEVTTFPPNEHGVPVICPVIGKELKHLHDVLVECCENEGIEYSHRYPDFKPHVTLSYAHDDVSTDTIYPVLWHVCDMVLWGGDETDHRLATSFEFLGHDEPAHGP
jgi:2'-5' RNA ligase